MALVWKKFGPANYYALTREGGKYTVDRLSQSWMANFLPTGNAEGGRVRLTPDSRQGSLSEMKNICEAHSSGHARTVSGTPNTAIVSKYMCDMRKA